MFYRVFCTVAESVGEHLSPKNSSVVSWSFMSNALMVVIKTLLKCMNIITNENIVEAGNEIYLLHTINYTCKYIFNQSFIYFTANNCVWLILDILQCQMPSINDLMLKVVELQMSRANEFSLTVIVSMFRMISKVSI